jgi:GntR family transcriptional repressor for pyruvate dehydrogenase complex
MGTDLELVSHDQSSRPREDPVGAFAGVFTPVRTGRGFEDVAGQIEAAIAAGKLKTGERLPNEVDLAALFGLSRATVREGIRSLEASGIVEVRRGASGGIYVVEPGAQQVAKALQALLRFRRVTARDLVEFRSSFEAETASWAAERATEDEAAQIVGIAEDYCVRAPSPNTIWDELVELDLAFHERVAAASHNQVRVAIMMAIQGSLHDASLRLAPTADVRFRRREGRELRAIARAISARDAVRARSLMRRHVSWNAALEAST